MAAIAATVAVFRPVSVVARTFGAIRRNFRIFIALAVSLVGLPSAAALGLVIILGENPALNGAADLAFCVKVAFLVGLAGAVILRGAVIYATTAARIGDRPTLATCLRAGLRNAVWLIPISVVVALAELIGLVFFIVPGVVVATTWIIAKPAQVAEGTGVFGSLALSAKLTRGHRWAILALILAFIVGYWLALSIVIAPAALASATGWMVALGLLSCVGFGVLQTAACLVGAAGVASIYCELTRAPDEDRPVATVVAQGVRPGIHELVTTPALSFGSWSTRAAAFAAMSNEQVLVAAAVPDYPPEVLAEVRAEVDWRGLEAPETIDFVAPSFVTEATLPHEVARLTRGVDSAFRRREQLRTLARWASVALLAIAVAAGGVFMWRFWGLRGELEAAGAFAQHQISDEDVPGYYTLSALGLEPPIPAMARLRDYRVSVAALRIDILAFCLFVIATGVNWIAGWRGASSARVLFLRKFNNRLLDRGFNRIMSANLRHVGNVIGLADRYVRMSWAQWVALHMRNFGRLPILPLLLRKKDRTRWGPPFVANIIDFRNLLKNVQSRRWLQFVSQLSSAGYFVSSTDAWWQNLVSSLMLSTDIILLDLSEWSSGVDWEIRNIDRLSLWHKVVLIAHDGPVDALQAVAPRMSRTASPAGVRCFRYQPNGQLTDQRGFRLAIAHALERSVAHRDRSGLST